MYDIKELLEKNYISKSVQTFVEFSLSVTSQPQPRVPIFSDALSSRVHWPRAHVMSNKACDTNDSDYAANLDQWTLKK